MEVSFAKELFLDVFYMRKLNVLGVVYRQFFHHFSFLKKLHSAFLKNRKNNFSFRQINPVGSEDQNLDNYHINGDYIGYFSNSFEFATAHYLPDNTGSPGYLKFTRDSVNDFDQIEKINLMMVIDHKKDIEERDILSNCKM